MYEAAVKAITATDKAVKTVYEACKQAGYVLVRIATQNSQTLSLNYFFERLLLPIMVMQKECSTKPVVP